MNKNQSVGNLSEMVIQIQARGIRKNQFEDNTHARLTDRFEYLKWHKPIA